MEVMSEQYQVQPVSEPSAQLKKEDEIKPEYSTYEPKILSSDINLSRLHIQKFRLMKSKFPDESDETLARFLIGKGMDVEKAKEQLTGHIEWRSMNWPIKKSSCLNELATGKLYSYGVDKAGRPLIIFSPRFNFPKERDVKEMALMFLWWMQHAISRLPEHKSKFTVLINRVGSGRKNIDPDLSKELSKTFQDNFPERLHTCVIYPTGLMYCTMWNLVSLFLDANTKAKVKPVMTMTGVREFIDDQYIPVEMGGTCNYSYNMDDYNDPA